MNYNEFSTVSGSEKPYQPQPRDPSYDLNSVMRKTGGKKTRGKRRKSKRRR